MDFPQGLQSGLRGRSRLVLAVMGLLLPSCAACLNHAAAESTTSSPGTEPVVGEMSAPRSRHENESVPHEIRIRKVRARAAAIKPGTKRAAVEKIFLRQDGGVSVPSSTRYYEGSEIMVEVRYDQSGGRWKPQNRVNGALRVYRSSFHTR
ncbi:MAG: hypothetical protein V4671_17465 [Armatimonadota bacterium]